ncbi:IS21 family transposase [Candidatus Finniella inopinata]|uniref:IS21 family transposase n=2 Tax=Candidatus Finniella inopinata TaxID=1696036 RepID=A0A4Q7DNI1_9PROT|nr:IS21 family transposase [Candidatus Finniella inopinata]RZI45452.1 IS21 family transposase [Candidatus Finniella inopinata]RZI45472.1 IS21 family transposase [Candidatus Finniella inopinata]RZI45592.1 IS21 family transposase [Candidatus Finniella inopinata]RZI46099.1 IS21 family transposase [Candidatus Finniella inopinata]RZI46436.1 IS21 family transposase [Candidatus Finniella inopinata]
MSRSHISMRKIREILRLRYSCGCSYQEIAKSIGISASTAVEGVKRAKAVNLSWPVPDNLGDEELEIKLYPPAQKINKEQRGEIDCIYIHKELKCKHVTLQLLWSEYKEKYPQGISYSQFCDVYRGWRNSTLDVWMHQTHKAGERLFVDYAGQTMSVVTDTSTGEVGEAQIFVAALGASSFTYVEATWTQTLADWIKSHVNAFEYYGGCPEIVVPDNLKSGVHKAHLYEPDINPTYQDMASYYGVAIIPTRSRSPKDKAKVENAVQQVERQILAKLRNRTFFSLSELNQAIQPLLDVLNRRPFQKLPGSRLSHFQDLEKQALKSLPTTRYEYAEWKKVKAGFNYHIELDKHFYSVPYALAKESLYVRYGPTIVEIFCQNKCVATHVRSYGANGYTTNTLHMPKAHQAQVEWTPERIVSWAKKTGEATAKLIEVIMASRAHPQQGFRTCLGILRLGKSYGEDRLELACKRALEIGGHSYKNVESILKNKMDQQSLSSSSEVNSLSDSHEYIRGQKYFK